MSLELSREEILATKDHVSVSRIQRFLQCKLSYKFSYLDKKRPAKSDILNFGTWVHACLESIYKWVLLEEHSGRIPKETISKICSSEAGKMGGVDLETYQEGLELVQDYCKLNQDIDHERVIAVEKAFQIKLASGVMLVGVIDRLEYEDDETVLVVDYKTNRALYTEDELEANLQMSTYGLAVKSLWPSVKTVKYRFDMLRHSKELRAERKAEELSEALDYLSAMSIAIRDAKEFPSKINQFCPWCDHRGYCDDYQALLKSGPDSIVYSDDIENICNAREQASAVEHDAKRKRQDLEKQIKSYMRKKDLDKLDVDGLRYLNHQNVDQVYVLETAFNRINSVLKDEAGENSKDTFNRLVLEASLEHKQLMEFVESLGLDRAKKARLKFDLERESTKKKKHSPFLMAVKIK
jgi:putative RecB family exonuclease